MSLAGVLRRKGAAVTFSTTARAYDAATDLSAASATATITGYAMEVDDPKVYEELELIATDAPLLVFHPDTAGQLPSLTATVVWGGITYAIKTIKRLAMAGTPTAAFIQLER